MKRKVIALALAAIAVPAAAQSGGMSAMDHSKMGMDKMMQPTPANPFPPAEMKMHERMMAAMGADASETWVRKMIEHHRGAIDTSRIVLQHTRDPKVRQMANKAISEQERGIAELQAWLRQHGKRAQ